MSDYPYDDFDEDETQARLPVYQGDRVVGTVPTMFMPDPSSSRSALYDVRPGDWTPTSDGWRVNVMLGLGDLMAMPGFEAAPIEGAGGTIHRGP